MSPKGRLHSRHTRVGVKLLGEGRGSGFFYPPLITCWWRWGHKSWPILDPQGASSWYSAQWWTKTSLWFIYTAQHRWPQLLYVPLYCSSNCTLDPGLDRSSGSDYNYSVIQHFMSELSLKCKETRNPNTESTVLSLSHSRIDCFLISNSQLIDL